MGLARLCLRNGALLRGHLSPAYSHAFAGAAVGGGATMGPLDLLRSRSPAAAAAAAKMPWINCSSSSSSPFSSGAATVQANDAGSKAPAAAEKRELVAASSRRGGRGRSWRSPWDLVPFRLNTDGLGNALMQVSENLNRVLENWMPSRLLGRMREDDSCYKLRFEVPGLSKEDVRVTVEDGMLVVRGERKEEEAFDEDDEERGGGWYSQRYGFYNTSLLLPDDAEVERIKAEVKNGLLYVTIPRSAEKRRNATEVKIQ